MYNKTTYICIQKSLLTQLMEHNRFNVSKIWMKRNVLKEYIPRDSNCLRSGLSSIHISIIFPIAKIFLMTCSYLLCLLLYKGLYIKKKRKNNFYGDSLYKTLKFVKWRHICERHLQCFSQEIVFLSITLNDILKIKKNDFLW